MIKKIILFFLILMSSLFIVSQSKYIKQKEITIANVNIDTVIPKIELLNIQNIMKKNNERTLFDMIANLKIIESSIKENNFNEIRIKIDGIDVKDFELIKTEEHNNEMNYNLKIKDLNQNQIIKIIIPEGIIVDNANNKNVEKIIEHIIL